MVPPAADRLRIPLTNLDEELVSDTAIEALSSYGTKAMQLGIRVHIFSAGFRCQLGVLQRRSLHAACVIHQQRNEIFAASHLASA